MSNKKETLAREAFQKASMGIILIELIENQMSEATADTKCINRKGASFWIEIKALDDWPARAGTAPLRNSFERGQIPFLKQWMSWNGKAYVLLRVGQEFFLLNPKSEIPLVEATQKEIRDTAIRIGLVRIILFLEELN